MITKEQLENLVTTATSEGIQKIVCGGVVFYEGKVLLLKRAANEFMSGLVELPSGTRDNEELLDECLKREVKEETNLELQSIDGYIGSFDYVSGSGKKTRQFNFVGRGVGTIALNPTEHDDYYLISDMEGSKGLNISAQTLSIIEKGLLLQE